MNWQVFGTIGYLGIALGAAAVLVWLGHWFRQHRWLPYIGLGLAIGSFVCAKLNSTHHVARIELDPSIMLAEMAKRQQAKEQALIDARSGEVDNISFAEDAQGEKLDTAGMDEVDLKYMKAIVEGDTPDWKNRKRQRGDNAQDDDSLESKIGAKAKTEGADVAALEDEAAPEPILLDEASMVLAQKLDLWNLRLIWWLLGTAIVVLLLDYLRRANLYREALWPIPLPSTWRQAFTPLPLVFNRPQNARRDIAGELAWLTRRGDHWIYFTDRPEETKELVAAMKKMARWPYRLDLIQIDDKVDNELIFESLWYGRASFIGDSMDRNLQLLSYCLTQLKHRRSTKARAPQNIHLIWDCATELSPEAYEAFEQRAQYSGASLFVIPKPATQS